MTNGLEVYLLSGYNQVTLVGSTTITAVISGNDVNVSGETVYFINDGLNNVVRISGQTVSIAGGINTSISGQPVLISGQTIQIAGGINVSGSPVRVSGETVRLVNDGINNVVQISGQTINTSVSVTTNVSGQALAQVIPTSIVVRGTLQLTGNSGGTAFLSGGCISVIIRNIGVSGTVTYIGSNVDPPWVASGQTYPMASGFGLWLRDGDGVTIPTNNMVNLKAVTAVSGQYISYMGVQY